MHRFAHASWTGDGKTGKGTLSTQSKVLINQPYTFQSRFIAEDGLAGTNPEELLAAAHAGCFTMALSFMLAAQGYEIKKLATMAKVHMNNATGHFVVERIEINLQAEVPEISTESFNDIARLAKTSCPISQALAATPVKLLVELN
jgi:lipoyl-dependent peroxiredoxin